MYGEDKATLEKANGAKRKFAFTSPNYKVELSLPWISTGLLLLLLEEASLRFGTVGKRQYCVLEVRKVPAC